MRWYGTLYKTLGEHVRDRLVVGPEICQQKILMTGWGTQRTDEPRVSWLAEQLAGLDVGDAAPAPLPVAGLSSGQLCLARFSTDGKWCVSLAEAIDISCRHLISLLTPVLFSLRCERMTSPQKRVQGRVDSTPVGRVASFRQDNSKSLPDNAAMPSTSGCRNQSSCNMSGVLLMSSCAVPSGIC